MSTWCSVHCGQNVTCMSTQWFVSLVDAPEQSDHGLACMPTGGTDQRGCDKSICSSISRVDILYKTNIKRQYSPPIRLIHAGSHQTPSSRAFNVASTEGYTPAVRPAACVRNNPDNKQDRQFIVIGFATFSHSTPLHCAIRPLGTLFSFLSPPPPR